MDKTEAALGAFLKQKALESWESKTPYLLSFLSPDLKTEGSSYKDIVGEDETLKQFVVRTGDAYGYKLVQHPAKKAKVGVIPIGEEFTFEDETRASSHNLRESRPDGVLVDFLKALGRLPASDVDKVVIPASVLVKLARHR